MLEKRNPIPVSRAVSLVMEAAGTGTVETVSILASHGRVLAKDIIADHDIPLFDRSPYDGFAIRSIDTADARSGNGVTLEVIGEIGAGTVFPIKAGPFQTVRIMTGAPIPDGCDAVIMLELTKEITKDSQTFIEIKRSLKAGENISFQGEDTKKGTILAQKGAYINAGITALLATFGSRDVPVVSKPVIGVLATGSELVEVEEPLEPGKIRNSNAYMIIAQIERAGGRGVYLGKLNDDKEKCLEAVQNALSDVDHLITTGGVSVGDYDYLPEIYKEMGAEVLFNKVAMRPGSVTTVARMGKKLLFGLSGNPSACYVGFELFVRPIVRSTLLSERPHLRKVKGVLGEDFTKANPFTRFVRGKIEIDDNGTLVASPTGFNKSSAVSSLADTDVFLVLPGGTRGYQKGMLVDILLLDDQQGSEWPWGNIVPSYK
ncbi:molybdopterin molybdotransferase MoeA [Falsibacillus albus]|uniref:Molybdopterin molybdenumtransferase n=1 Tax=Falsibacillus albus TaxID=2478915 RepID=A0A3L7K0Q1_9BACI|nr:gephyrin-like molybdotransferase Glp [Falsibacillus albus]RLQ96648.1 molybdopterin molybdenumtransferase MoeA [Falsibacillus albus]